MALTAQLTLDRAFINLASDPSQYVVCGTAGAVGGGGTRTDTVTQEGSFRQYANYNTRLIQGTARSRILAPLVLRACTPAQVAQILAFIGKTILFRDTYGRRIWGSYLSPAITDIPRSGQAGSTLLSDVAITIQEITYDEGV